MAANVAKAQLASGSMSDASSGERTKLRVALKKGELCATKFYLECSNTRPLNKGIPR